MNNLSEFQTKFELIFEAFYLEIEALKMDISREINKDNILIVRGNNLQISGRLKKNKWMGLLGLLPIGG